METTGEERNRSWKLATPGEPTGGLRRTPRILGMLHELYDNEYLHSGHFKALSGGDKAARLLLRMARHRLVVRVAGEWGWQQQNAGGSPPQIYALAEPGAYDLARAGMISVDEWREWTREHRKEREPRFLPHQIANADVTVWFHQDCAARGYAFERGPRIAYGRNPRALMIPDRARPLMTDNTFRIGHDDRRVLLFIETDRGTEPYARHDTRDLKSIERMIQGYLAYARAGMAERQFGVADWYQLTVTTGDERRVEGIARTAQIAGAGEHGDRFLVTNFDALALTGPFDAPWMNPAGSLTTLAP